MIWTTRGKIKPSARRRGTLAALALGAVALILANRVVAKATDACHLEHAGLTFDVRHLPATADWAPSLEIAVSDTLMPLSRLTAAEPGDIENCAIVRGDADRGVALVVSLRGAGAIPPRQRIFRWQAHGLVEERSSGNFPANEAGKSPAATR